MCCDRKVWRGIGATLQAIAIATGLLFSTLAQAGESFYRWTDEHGRVHFSDKPPATGQAQKITAPTPPPARSAPAAKGARAGKSQDPATPRDPIVEMYSAAWCGVCKSARAYFRAKGIRFKEYDIEKSVRGKRGYSQLKGTGVPIILVGKARMNGFTPAGFEDLLRRVRGK